MQLPKIKNKRAALEMSIGTVVIIVLGMTMLILGLVLVKKIFIGASESVDLVNKNVKSELNKLFNEEGIRSVVYLADNEAEIKAGKKYNLAFGIKNIITGAEGADATFSYEVKAAEVEEGCGITLEDAEDIIVVGKTGGPLSISPGGDPTERVVQLRAEEGFPLCTMTFDLIVKQDGNSYDTNFFIVTVTG